MIAATVPAQRPADGRLLAVDAIGQLTHHRRTEFPALVEPGDLVIANDAATLPASLSGTHLETGAAVELRLAGRTSLRPQHVARFTAVAFGAGDFRTPTEQRPPPPTLARGDHLRLGPLRAEVLNVLGHPRLVDVGFAGSAREIWAGLARHGRPIQYSYLQEPLAIWDTWTSIAGVPVAFEPPSAGFLLDWQMIAALRARGAAFAAITHVAGISSTGDVDLDALLPLPEPYRIPPATVSMIRSARKRGDRIVAVGTTVVRALEDAAARHGAVRAGTSVATLRVGPDTALRVVDALVTGLHEPGTSHYELLRAFQSDDVLRKIVKAAEEAAYRNHEFGDWAFIAADQCERGRRSRLAESRPDAPAMRSATLIGSAGFVK